MDNLMKLNTEMYESLGKSAANTIQYFENDLREDMLKQLRNEVEKLCCMEEQVKCANQIRERMEEAYETEEYTEEERNNLVEQYKNEISQITPDASSNANLLEFDRIVSALENDADGYNGAGDVNDDSDLQLTRNTVNVIDPVTKKRMTDPVKNVICSHVYDRESVAALISVNPNTRCPVPGCKYKEYLIMSNMRPDIVTKTYLQKHQA